MKYYIYISDAKVDMLFPQVPHDIKQKIASEFGIDFKVFVAKRKVESESEENRISRLEAVVSYIREYGNLGSVDEPDEYVAGTMPMRNIRLEQWNSSAIYFSGHTDTTMFGFGGSAKHLIGALPDPSVPIGTPSHTWAIISALNRATAEWRPQDSADQTSLSAVAELETEVEEGLYENIEFFAKRLLFNDQEWVWTPRGTRSWQVLLGSPLYLAKAD